MGPFSYIPNMECNHAILCMKNKTSGVIHINNTQMNFNNGTGYIEKDWGYSFPKEYIWCQGNDFKEANASFMVSIANIPFKFFSFQGIICVLIANGKEYKFERSGTSNPIVGQVREERITVKIPCIQIGTRKLLDVEFALVDNRHKSTPVLLNRDIMSKLAYMINPAAKHTFEDEFHSSGYNKHNREK